MSEMRLRFPPSPTGKIHIGNMRTALFNWIWAKKNNGELVLRIEDTDQKRSTKESEKKLINQLKWLGLDWDEGPENDGSYGPYHQSKRLELYKKYAKKLIDMDKAYYCYCTDEELEAKREKAIKEGKPPVYDGHCRNLTEKQKKEYEKEGRNLLLGLKLIQKRIINSMIWFIIK